MRPESSTCIKCVVACAYCNGACTLHGKTSAGNTRYRCRNCRKTQVKHYRYKACEKSTDQKIISLQKEGCGIRSIGRILKIANGTVLRRIQKIAGSIRKPAIVFGKNYELDEVCTYIGKKSELQWIVYAIRKDTKEVVDFTVGCRTKKTLKRIADTLILSKARHIYTDKLKQYSTLLPRCLHKTTLHGTNHIERKNLTLRTHLKRLSRRTICFSRSTAMLIACLKIYFWT